MLRGLAAEDDLEKMRAQATATKQKRDVQKRERERPRPVIRTESAGLDDGSARVSKSADVGQASVGSIATAWNELVADRELRPVKSSSFHGATSHHAREKG